MQTDLPDFQIFAKPVGSACNLSCRYCYYLDKSKLYAEKDLKNMSDDILEEYIRQHIEATQGSVILFSWHGGEPTLAGLDFYKKAVAIQKKYNPPGKKIMNGIQTNGTRIEENWCKFLLEEKFVVGISLDGPPELHNFNRLTKGGLSSFQDTMKGYDQLLMTGIDPEILCVVNAENVRFPLDVYRFFRHLGASYVTFIPLVEKLTGSLDTVTARSVPARDFGNFLCAIFDEWIQHGIGRIKVQIFEEAIRRAFNQEHTLCIFKPVCGGVPVVEHNGDFYSCDHFVDKEHLIGNIGKTPIAEMLTCERQQSFGLNKVKSLPRYCMKCEVSGMCNGECPKNRFISSPDGEPGLNYLCEGYKIFFKHCRPFVESVAVEFNKGTIV
jgi:uncharacterized protein